MTASAAQVVSLLTQTTVSTDDPAFQNPEKFIGPVYSKEDAERCAPSAAPLLRRWC